MFYVYKYGIILAGIAVILFLLGWAFLSALIQGEEEED